MLTINPFVVGCAVLGCGLAILLYYRGRAEFEAFKAHVWTPHGIAIALVWALGFTGILSALMFINVQVLGNDIVLDTPSQGAIRQKLR